MNGPKEIAVKVVREVLHGAIVVESPRFGDDRGTLIVSYEIGAANKVGIDGSFVQDNHSISKTRGTVRGLHLQLPPHSQGKLVWVLQGSIFDVVVDLRPGSKTHGQHASVNLNAGDRQQLWIPPGFAHGFCTLEPDTEVFYKVDAPYQPAAECSLAWDDPTLAIKWPVDAGQAVLSDKDTTGMALAQVVKAIEESQP